MAMLLVLSFGVAVWDSVITMYGVFGRRVRYRQRHIAFGTAPPWHSGVPSLFGAARPRGGGAARQGFAERRGGEALLGARRRRGGAARCGAATHRGGGVARKGPAEWRRGSVLGVGVGGGAACRCGGAAARGGAVRTRGGGAAAAWPSGRHGGGHRRTRRCSAPTVLGGVAAAIRGGGDAADGLTKRRREAHPGARRRGASIAEGCGASARCAGAHQGGGSTAARGARTRSSIRPGSAWAGSSGWQRRRRCGSAAGEAACAKAGTAFAAGSAEPVGARHLDHLGGAGGPRPGGGAFLRVGPPVHDAGRRDLRPHRFGSDSDFAVSDGLTLGTSDVRWITGVPSRLVFMSLQREKDSAIAMERRRVRREISLANGGGGDVEGGDRNRQRMKGGGRGASAVAS